MDMNEYQGLAKRTAMYPRHGKGNIMYTILGLCGEAGEVANKVKKVERDYGGILTDEMRDRLMDELGDTLWYIAMAALELGVPLDTIAKGNITKLMRRSEANTIHGDSREHQP